MKKTLYIIPGWQENCNDEPYQRLADAAKKKGYKVIFHNIDWGKPLSLQTLPVPEDAVIFGFSLGAILAWLVAQNYPCRHLILASMTPYYSFTDPKIKESLIDLAGSEFVDDVTINLSSKHQAKKQTIMYSVLEGEPADVLVPGTEHELNNKYTEEIAKIL